MTDASRSTSGWAVVLPPLVLVIAVTMLALAAPGFLGPMFDPAVSIAGMPAGMVVIGVTAVIATLGAFAWVNVMRRTGSGVGHATVMVTIALAVVVLPVVVALIKALAGPG